ncbi:unnamed protein product [Moneuplotes crassus]|uniref:Uncharacterized protein n=2 Tax=Euplotes crassus TaxID=5936 RepID=A0AAD1XIQ9_EUPCR|nr:unnamed protein product [Moneuplotes crassus]
MPPSSVGHTPIIYNNTTVSVAMRTFKECDIEPVNNEVFEPVVVYKRREVDRRPKTKRDSPKDTRFWRTKNYNTQKRTIPRKRPSPKPKKELKKEMGEIDYRKWADNWNPCVDVQRVKPKVDTNFKTALELTQKEKELKKFTSSQKKSKKKRMQSAKPRETYLDYQLGNMKKRLPSKEDVFRGTFHAKNRYKDADDKENLIKNLQHKSNTEMLKQKIYNEHTKNAKANQLQKAKEYSQIVKLHNKAVVEEQRREGKMPGQYTAKLIDEAQRAKNSENNKERENRRKIRQERLMKKHISIHERDDDLLYKYVINVNKRKEMKKKKNQKNEDLMF